MASGRPEAIARQCTNKDSSGQVNGWGLHIHFQFIYDYLTHHANIFYINSSSYRLKDKLKKAKTKIF